MSWLSRIIKKVLPVAREAVTDAAVEVITEELNELVLSGKWHAAFRKLAFELHTVRALREAGNMTAALNRLDRITDDITGMLTR